MLQLTIFSIGKAAKLCIFFCTRKLLRSTNVTAYNLGAVRPLKILFFFVKLCTSCSMAPKKMQVFLMSASFSAPAFLLFIEQPTASPLAYCSAFVNVGYATFRRIFFLATRVCCCCEIMQIVATRISLSCKRRDERQQTISANKVAHGSMTGRMAV